MGSKRQQTFAKMERERRVKEKRALKQEKKQPNDSRERQSPCSTAIFQRDRTTR